MTHWNARYRCFLVLGMVAQGAIAFSSLKPASKIHHRRSIRLFESNDNNDERDTFWKKFPFWSVDQRISTENTSFGVLQTIQVATAPVQDILDEYSSGWALSYADLKPDSAATAPGRLFLVTNLAYLVTGLLLQYHGANELGLATDLCAAFSFQYHYQQLEATNTVRAALMLDYFFAALAMGLATFYLVMSVSVTSLLTVNAVMAIGLAGVSLGCLGLSWKYEYGKPYMLWHGFWHLTSAGAGYAIGNLHSTLM